VDEIWVEADDARLFVRGWGEARGEPLLCWHGVGYASPASLTFADLAALLAQHGLRTFALDAPGFGRSAALAPDRYHPHALVALVPSVLDALDVERAVFVGYSWGGDIGCHLAARHPERLSGLAILDAGYRDPPFDPSIPYETYVQLNERKAEARDAAVEPWVMAAAEHGMAHAPPSSTRNDVATSNLPVLLVAAGDAPQTELEQLARDVPQAEIHRVEGFGHNVLADGGHTVADLLVDWLAATRSITPASPS
jgi:pimeloyl-ACP methyl ester carboxylesterase